MAKNEYTKLDFTNDLNVNFDILISNWINWFLLNNLNKFLIEMRKSH